MDYDDDDMDDDYGSDSSDATDSVSSTTYLKVINVGHSNKLSLSHKKKQRSCLYIQNDLTWPSTFISITIKSTRLLSLNT